MARIRAGLPAQAVAEENPNRILAGSAHPIYVLNQSTQARNKVKRSAGAVNIVGLNSVVIVNEDYIATHGLKEGSAIPVVLVTSDELKSTLNGSTIPVYIVGFAAIQEGYVLPDYIISQRDYVELLP